MDLKDLNNYQLVLLVLLVSFVTSIATGIITVTLLQQASPQVSKVINQVVDRTIDQVVPDSINPVKPQTIIINEDDLVAASLAQGFQEVGALYTEASQGSSSTAQVPASGSTSSSLAASAVLAQTGDASTTSTQTLPVEATLLSLGVLVDTNGTFIIPGAYTFTAGDYVTISGSTYDVASGNYNKGDDISVLMLVPEKGAEAFTALSPNGVGDLPKVGQTALIIGTNGAFMKTVISKIILPAGAGSGGSLLKVNDPIDAKFAGAPVLSEDGKIIGLVTFDASGASQIYAADTIENALMPETSVPQA